MTEEDIASIRATILDSNGIWAKDPAKQTERLQQFESQIASARVSGELPPAPAPYDTKAAAAEEINRRFPMGEQPLSEGSMELVGKAMDSVKDLPADQLRSQGEWNARQIEETEEAVYENGAFKRWHTVRGSEALDRLVQQAGGTPGTTEAARLRAMPLPALKILASVGVRNKARSDAMKQYGI